MALSRDEIEQPEVQRLGSVQINEMRLVQEAITTGANFRTALASFFPVSQASGSSYVLPPSSQTARSDDWPE